MKTVYVIKLTYKIGPSKGKSGYHSAWFDKSRAYAYAFIVVN